MRTRVPIGVSLWLLATANGATPDPVPGYSVVASAQVAGTPDSTSLATSSSKLSAAECGSWCDTSTSCVSFDWCENASPSCNLNSAGRSHPHYSTGIAACDNYEKVAFPPLPPHPPPPPLPACNGVDVVVVLDRSSTMGASDWNTRYVPFLKSVLDSVAPSSASSTRFGVVVYPSEAGATAGDVAGNAAVVAGLGFDSTPIDTLITAVTSQATTHCAATPTGSLEYPCGGWTFSPMWKGLQLAESLLLPAGDTYASQRKVVVVVSDSVPAQSAPGTQYNRASYLTLQASTSLKTKGVTVLSVGVGGKYTGALGGSNCEPMSCTDASGGLQIMLGTNAAAGTVAFTSVDTSVENCNANQGCGTNGAATLDALVSGASQTVRSGNAMVASSTSALSTLVSSIKTKLCFPHSVSVAQAGVNCGTPPTGWHAKNLGNSYSSAEACGAAAVQDSACPFPRVIQYSTTNNNAQGCSCCTTNYVATASAAWSLYAISEPHLSPSPPPPPPVPLTSCFGARTFGQISQAVMYPPYGSYTTNAELAQQECLARKPWCIGISEQVMTSESRYYLGNCGTFTAPNCVKAYYKTWAFHPLVSTCSFPSPPPPASPSPPPYPPNRAPKPPPPLPPGLPGQVVGLTAQSKEIELSAPIMAVVILFSVIGASVLAALCCCGLFLVLCTSLRLRRKKRKAASKLPPRTILGSDDSPRPSVELPPPLPPKNEVESAPTPAAASPEAPLPSKPPGLGTVVLALRLLDRLGLEAYHQGDPSGPPVGSKEWWDLRNGFETGLSKPSMGGMGIMLSSKAAWGRLRAKQEANAPASLDGVNTTVTAEENASSQPTMQPGARPRRGRKSHFWGNSAPGCPVQ